MTAITSLRLSHFRSHLHVSLEPDTRPVVLFGPNGAGKSSLMRTISTLQSADSGSITFDGIDVANLKGKELAKFRNKNIGFVNVIEHIY